VLGGSSLIYDVFNAPSVLSVGILYHIVCLIIECWSAVRINIKSRWTSEIQQACKSCILLLLLRPFVLCWICKIYSKCAKVGSWTDMSLTVFWAYQDKMSCDCDCNSTAVCCKHFHCLFVLVCCVKILLCRNYPIVIWSCAMFMTFRSYFNGHSSLSDAERSQLDKFYEKFVWRQMWLILRHVITLLSTREEWGADIGYRPSLSMWKWCNMSKRMNLWFSNLVHMMTLRCPGLELIWDPKG